eukprot:SAG11_NODE_695_length_7694_cov_5.002502_1_plen_182_part_00
MSTPHVHECVGHAHVDLRTARAVLVHEVGGSLHRWWLVRGPVSPGALECEMAGPATHLLRADAHARRTALLLPSRRLVSVHRAPELPDGALEAGDLERVRQEPHKGGEQRQPLFVNALLAGHVRLDAAVQQLHVDEAKALWWRAAGVLDVVEVDRRLVGLVVIWLVVLVVKILIRGLRLRV